MKNLKAKAVCVMLSASMAAMGLTGCGSDNVDGTKTAITVNDESITLGQANFMLRYQQATMYNYYSKMYSMYGMQMPSEMYDKEGDDGKTTGETFKEQSLDTIEKELLMRQHAEEYGISLTDEEKQQAKEAAQAFADKNGDDVMKKLHATVEDIQDALELYVIQTKIYDPIIADVDTEVSDEEAKQTSISYITVSTAGTEKDDDGKTIDLTDEEKAAKKEIAQRFLDLLKESEDPAAASFTDLRKELNDQLNAENTADSTDSADSSDESSSSSDASDTSASLFWSCAISAISASLRTLPSRNAPLTMNLLSFAIFSLMSWIMRIGTIGSAVLVASEVVPLSRSLIASRPASLSAKRVRVFLTTEYSTSF